jgi:TM2 domain-containing membrane protein YozV
MNIDQQIKQALNDDFKKIVNNNEQIDANPFKQMKAGFNGKMKWIYVLVIFFSTLFFIGMLYCGYQFYHAQEVKALLSWGIGIVILALFTQISKMWYWTEMGHNRVIREIKLLELQVAHLTEQIDKN